MLKKYKNLKLRTYYVKTGLIVFAFVVGVGLFANYAFAVSITNLTLTNSAAVQAETNVGDIYATVSVTAGKTTPALIIGYDKVSFSVDANNAFFTELPNFGIQTFGFNVDAIATGVVSIVGLPSGWNTKFDKSQDGFGKFELVESGNGNSRQDPLSFMVTTANTFNTAAAIESAFKQTNTSGHNYATHIADFSLINDSNVTSAFFTDGASVPEPTTMLLMGIGMVGLVGAGIRRKSKK